MLSRSSHGCGHLLHHLRQTCSFKNVNDIQIFDKGGKLQPALSSESRNSIHSSQPIEQNKSQLAADNETVASGLTEESNPVQKMETNGVIPGKGPPPEPPVDCCMSGCVNCVWIAYAESLKDYYSDGGKAARDALEQIDNPSLKMFVKLEMGLL